MDESEVRKFEGQFELQRITKLSEAIRIGARIRPQCTRSYFANGSSCAIGAAWEGLTGDYGVALLSHLISPRFGISPRLYDDIINWNDNDGLTREEIADRLESMGY